MIIKPLTVWVQNILPVVYDDSLSYLEMVAKINAKTNEIISQTNENTHAIETLAETIAELGDIEELRALLDEIETIIEDLYTTDTPLMDGTASAGSANHAARSDHVHPSDTSKAPINHASNESTYGVGNDNNYGHVKITDDINNTDTGTAVKASVVKTVNEKLNTFARDNLLDNWYFVGGGSQRTDISGAFPINQRGQTYYANQDYTIDRWFLNGISQAITIANTNDGIVIAVNSELGQKIENGYNSLVGKTVTLSVLTATSLIEVTGVVASSGESVSKSFEGVKIYIDSGTGNQSYITVVIKNIDSDGIIKAIKLELGTEQTLAHQVNGQWVMNEIPDYGQEMAKCQRYYEAGIGYIGAWPIADSFDTSIPFKVTKAKTPTFENLSCAYWTGDSYETVPNTNANINDTAPLFSVRIFSNNNGVPANSVYIVSVAASADL